jgi:hypothetical protein
MSLAVPIIPIVLVPLTFLFVLLIVLIAKAPKAGAWVVGGLVLLAPIILMRFLAAGALSQRQAMPLLLVPASFLFVLLVILTAKAPKVGVALIVAIVVMLVLGFFVMMPVVSHRSVHAVTTVAQPVALAPPQAPSPIWSEGVEQEFEADVYPSRKAAARALGLRMATPVRRAASDPNTSFEVILFQQGLDRALVEEFVRSLEKRMGPLKYTIAPDLRNIRPGEVGVTLRLNQTRGAMDSWAPLGEDGHVRYTSMESALVESGGILGTAFTDANRASVAVKFVEKPWVEDFAGFANTRPDQHYIVARSNETCTSEGEANLQALNDARARLTEALGTHSARKSLGLPRPAVTIKDVLMDGIVADRFIQSFAGSAGPIWRQALLIDASAEKLAWLNDRKTAELHVERVTWAGMIASAFGVLVVIVAAYLFLNMATKGYYEWALRIAGMVLAIAGIVSVFLVLR